MSISLKKAQPLSRFLFSRIKTRALVWSGSKAVVCNWGRLSTRGHLTMSGDILVVTTGGAIDTKGVEAMDAVKYPIMPRTISRTNITQLQMSTEPRLGDCSEALPALTLLLFCPRRRTFP